MNNIDRFINAIQVIDCEHTKTHIGNKGDGGYVILAEVAYDHTDNVYSFGVGYDVGFELDFLRLCPQTYFKLFDPTIVQLPSIPVEHCMAFSLQIEGIEEGGLHTIPEETLLKIDVESAEWDTLMDPLFKMRNCSQMVIEFHLVHTAPPCGLTPYFHSFYSHCFDDINEELFGKYADVLEKLTELFDIFHIHANNSLLKRKMGDYWLPPLLELSFVRKDLVECATPTKEHFPIAGLDYPNKPDRPDLVNIYPLGR